MGAVLIGEEDVKTDAVVIGRVADVHLFVREPERCDFAFQQFFKEELANRLLPHDFAEHKFVGERELPEWC